MKNRRLWMSLGIVIVLAALMLAGVYAFVTFRRIDGRSATEWLALADRASRSVAYRAEGTSMSNGIRAHFTLKQGMQGRYVMTTRDTGGRQSSFGYDGTRIWYTTGNTKKAFESAPAPLMPANVHGRILGTRVIAQRDAVRLYVASGAVEKTLTLDRNTGVVLAMTTRFRHRVISDMQVEKIDYRAVTVQSCASCCTSEGRTATPAEIQRVFGVPIVQPRWLPAGFTATGMLLGKCGMCSHDMATLHYSDGISAITLFEMPISTGCDMGEGCYQASQGSAVIANRRVRQMAVTAVGDVESSVLNRVLGSLL